MPASRGWPLRGLARGLPLGNGFGSIQDRPERAVDRVIGRKSRGDVVSQNSDVGSGSIRACVPSPDTPRHRLELVLSFEIVPSTFLVHRIVSLVESTCVH